MALPRFLIDPLPPTGQVELDGQEAQHASQVLRLKTDAEIVLFDGRGGEARAQVVGVSKRKLTARVCERTDTCRELPFEVDLIVALPKGERQKVLVEGLVQLGVARLTPLETQRGVAQPTDKALDRLRRSVVEASKQCGRNALMQIEPSLAVEGLRSEDEANASADTATVNLFAHPYGPARPVADIVPAVNSAVAQPDSKHTNFRVVVGPEGGFTDDEADFLYRQGWQQVSLGARLLRVEMAAISLAAYLALVHASSD